MARTYHYHWQHVPSQHMGVRQFNGTQHPVFNDTYGTAERTVRKVIAELLNNWNSQQPATWRYWITEEDVCQN